ncbi:MAG: ATP-binding protein [Methanosphaera stadtmanae]|nr:ATP-binding protein [Methanosphaera stadtmanae]
MENKNDLIANFITEQLEDIPNILNEELSFNQKKYNTRLEFYELTNHIKNFRNKNNTNRFIVLPGLRGVGKTTLLYQIYEYLLSQKINPNQILYLSCEQLNNITDYNLTDVVDIFLKTQHNTTMRLLDKEIYLLIDESQYSQNWVLSGKIIYDKSNRIFMIFTGSSALNLENNADAARRMIKNEITPLNYSEHLKLKYNINIEKLSKTLRNILFNQKISHITECERKINNILINNPAYTSNDWNDYFKFGGFPAYFKEINHRILLKKIVDMTERVINVDMTNIKNFTIENQINANRLLRYLSLQRSSDVSQVKLSKELNTSQSNIKNILNILEKTHLIYHLEAYGTSTKRISKAYKYYFATSSIKNALSTITGNTMKNTSEYEGILLENLVASTLNNIKKQENHYFTIYYDSNKKNNVDFLLQEEFKNPIPIEVGIGKKDKKQIKYAMNYYDSPYGIIVSNTTFNIEKKDDVIYIPPKTFSYL